MRFALAEALIDLVNFELPLHRDSILSIQLLFDGIITVITMLILSLCVKRFIHHVFLDSRTYGLVMHDYVLVLVIACCIDLTCARHYISTNRAISNGDLRSLRRLVVVIVKLG